jgi:hypothetical protein
MKSRVHSICNYIVIKWHIDDVLYGRPDLTDAEARRVLQYIQNNHSTSVGVNWDVIDAVTTKLYPENIT